MFKRRLPFPSHTTIPTPRALYYALSRCAGPGDPGVVHSSRVRQVPAAIALALCGMKILVTAGVVKLKHKLKAAKMKTHFQKIFICVRIMAGNLQ